MDLAPGAIAAAFISFLRCVFLCRSELYRSRSELYRYYIWYGVGTVSVRYRYGVGTLSVRYRYVIGTLSVRYRYDIALRSERADIVPIRKEKRRSSFRFGHMFSFFS